jgi:hypothetical protein
MKTTQFDLLITHLHPLAQIRQLEPLPLTEAFKECKLKNLSIPSLGFPRSQIRSQTLSPGTPTSSGS